jgi:hypothetical protein
MTVDNNLLIQDELTLIVVIANAHNWGFLCVPSSSSDAVFCIRSLRQNDYHYREKATTMQLLKGKSTVFRYYHSWRAFVRSDSGRWRSGRVLCTGCGRHLSKHKP